MCKLAYIYLHPYILFCCCDLDPDALFLRYKLDPDILEMYVRTKNKVSRSRISNVRAQRAQADATESVAQPHSQVVIKGEARFVNSEPVDGVISENVGS